MNENEPLRDDAEETPDNAGVRVPPPLIFLVFLLLGMWVDSPWVGGRLANIWLMLAGVPLAALGFGLVLTGARGHKKAGSNVEPWKPTTAIITTGLYGFSRNPIYLGMALAHAGIALAGGSLAALGGLAVCVMLVQTYVIAREERYLENKFGQEYRDYKRRVRCWI